MTSFAGTDTTELPISSQGFYGHFALRVCDVLPWFPLVLVFVFADLKPQSQDSISFI